MNFKSGVLVKVLLLAALLEALSGAASAEVVKGTVKSIAKDSKVFTLQSPQESLLFILWDDKTAWNGIAKPAGIDPDEAVTVEYSSQGDQAVATSIARVKPQIPAGVKALYLDTLEESQNNLKKTGIFLFVDTRPTDLFDRAHIPGAISVPVTRLEKRAFGLLPEDKGAPLVFYDQGQGGESASKAAELALKAGFIDVSLLPEGTAGWLSSGRVLASSTSFMRKSKPVIIDLRKPEEVSEGHIEGAVNFPFSGLKERYGFFPLARRGPIVLYSGSDSEAVIATEVVRKWGYRNVTIFSGGVTAWQNSAEVVQTGPAGEYIFTSSAGHTGQLAPKDFEKALSSLSMIEIVDVRSALEHAKGGFAQSTKIPLQDIPKRHGELNREKIQVVFSSNAEYTEMAYDFLKSKGYRVNYLSGIVEFDSEGKPMVK